MRAGSQIKLFFYCNPITLFLFLFLLSAGCTHLGIRSKASNPVKKDVERSYYQNGNLEYEAEFVNGKLDGTSKVWLEEGTLYSVSQYSNDQPHGAWKKFHPNGKLLFAMNYEYGEKHGTEKWYYENGQVKSEQEFEYGNAKSVIIRWNFDGTLLY